MSDLPTVSCVILAKNEGVGIKRAIMSARPYVDEVVVGVDTSSFDNTEKKARKYADKVNLIDWKDDFSLARNEAAYGVSSDFILVLDGHEYIKSCKNLKEALAGGVDILITPVLMETGSVIYQPRVYRSSLKYDGKVHNQIKSEFSESFNDLLIVHDKIFGQDPKSIKIREEQKDDMVPRHLLSSLKNDKTDTHASFHLGLHYHLRHNYNFAIKFYKLFLSYSKNKQQRWLVFFNLSLCYLSQGKKYRAFYFASRADDELPNRWEIKRLKGFILMASKKYSKAIDYFLSSLSFSSSGYIYKPLPFNKSGVYRIIGDCFFSLGNYIESVQFFRNALDIEKDDKIKKLLRSRIDLLTSLLSKGSK